MDVIQLSNDGRCRWLEKQVMNKIFPQAIRSAQIKDIPTQYMIIDWISNDNGKVGVD